jgi:hypothetical protein
VSHALSVSHISNPNVRIPLQLALLYSLRQEEEEAGKQATPQSQQDVYDYYYEKKLKLVRLHLNLHQNTCHHFIYTKNLKFQHKIIMKKRIEMFLLSDLHKLL